MLTREQILEMPAGPEMDALVAELVMGVRLDRMHERLLAVLNDPQPGQPSGKVARDANGGRGTYMRCFGCDLNGYGNEVEWGQQCPSPECKPYSTDIAAAWEVVEHVRALKQCHFSMAHSHAGMIATFWGHHDPALNHGQADQHGHAYGPPITLAICRAALLAVLNP